MGMDIFGNDGSYFRANIWSWRAILYAMELADYQAPESWGFNDGAGLETQSDCNRLADQLEAFLKGWDRDKLTLETQAVRVDDSGRFVEPGTAASHSPYQVDREHLQEFIAFLRVCDGFQIC